jgi:hypothetical protein
MDEKACQVRSTKAEAQGEMVRSLQGLSMHLLDCM